MQWSVPAQDARLQLNAVPAEVELDGTMGTEEWREAQTVTLEHGPHSHVKVRAVLLDRHRRVEPFS